MIKLKINAMIPTFIFAHDKKKKRFAYVYKFLEFPIKK